MVKLKIVVCASHTKIYIYVCERRHMFLGYVYISVERQRKEKKRKNRKEKKCII